MKVLISAYACSPYQGSEPGMGWNFVSNLSHLHELHILTESKYIPEFERYFEEHPEEKPYYHIYYIKRLRLNLLRKIWPPSYYWTYAAWQRKALKKAKELDAIENFDVVHQLNMVGYREPGYLWKLDKPFVWGPMGNFNITPWCMLPTMGLYGAIFYTCRNLINMWQMHFSARVRKAARKADVIICAMQDDSLAVQRLYGKNSIVIPEVGLTKLASNNNILQKRERGEKLRICWSGIHVARKALPILLEAIAASHNKDNVELHILGSGTCTKKWKALAQRLNIDNVIWYGQVDRMKAMDIMKQSHLFAISSLSDATSTVLLEALSLQIPVIALNHLGFASVINETCGIKIDIHSRNQVIKDYSSVLDKFCDDESYRQSLAEGALKRAYDFAWPKKVEVIDHIYKNIAKNDN